MIIAQFLCRGMDVAKQLLCNYHDMHRILCSGKIYKFDIVLIGIIGSNSMSSYHLYVMIKKLPSLHVYFHNDENTKVPKSCDYKKYSDI